MFRKVVKFLCRYSIGRNESVREKPLRYATKDEIIEAIKKLDGKEARNKDGV